MGLFRVIVMGLTFVFFSAGADPHDPFEPRRDPPKSRNPDPNSVPECDPSGPQIQLPGATTGEMNYRTPRVLSALGLSGTKEQAKAEYTKNLQRTIGAIPEGSGRWHVGPRVKGMKILSLGEGHGGLVPFLRAQGADAKGLDLAYRNEPRDDLAKLYRARHGAHLIPGDATKLPMADRSQDMVVSHAMGNLRDEFMKKAVAEAFRVTKVGGEIRFAMMGAIERDPKKTMDQVRDFLKGLPQSEFTAQVSLGPIDSRIRVDDLNDYPWDSLPTKDMMTQIEKHYGHAERAMSRKPRALDRNAFCHWDSSISSGSILTLVLRRKAD